MPRRTRWGENVGKKSFPEQVAKMMGQRASAFARLRLETVRCLLEEDPAALGWNWSYPPQGKFEHRHLFPMLLLYGPASVRQSSFSGARISSRGDA